MLVFIVESLPIGRVFANIIMDILRFAKDKKRKIGRNSKRLCKNSKQAKKVLCIMTVQQNAEKNCCIHIFFVRNGNMIQKASKVCSHDIS